MSAPIEPGLTAWTVMMNHMPYLSDLCTHLNIKDLTAFGSDNETTQQRVALKADSGKIHISDTNQLRQVFEYSDAFTTWALVLRDRLLHASKRVIMAVTSSRLDNHREIKYTFVDQDNLQKDWDTMTLGCRHNILPYGAFCRIAAAAEKRSGVTGEKLFEAVSSALRSNPRVEFGIKQWALGGYREDILPPVTSITSVDLNRAVIRNLAAGGQAATDPVGVSITPYMMQHESDAAEDIGVKATLNRDRVDINDTLRWESVRHMYLTRESLQAASVSYICEVTYSIPFLEYLELLPPALVTPTFPPSFLLVGQTYICIVFKLASANYYVYDDAARQYARFPATELLSKTQKGFWKDYTVQMMCKLHRCSGWSDTSIQPKCPCPAHFPSQSGACCTQTSCIPTCPVCR